MENAPRASHRRPAREAIRTTVGTDRIGDSRIGVRSSGVRVCAAISDRGRRSRRRRVERRAGRCACLCFEGCCGWARPDRGSCGHGPHLLLDWDSAPSSAAGRIRLSRRGPAASGTQHYHASEHVPEPHAVDASTGPACQARPRPPKCSIFPVNRPRFAYRAPVAIEQDQTSTAYFAPLKLRPFLEVAAEGGAAVEAVLAAHGTSRAEMLHPETRLPRLRCVAIVRALIAPLRDPLIGLRASQRSVLEDIDVLGYIARRCPNALAALEGLRGYSRLLADASEVGIERDAGQVIIRIGLAGGRRSIPELAVRRGQRARRARLAHRRCGARGARGARKTEACSAQRVSALLWRSSDLRRPVRPRGVRRSCAARATRRQRCAAQHHLARAR